ncbi:hypothetical protein [Rhodoblastus sp.]|uniref:hypothetical protein n=1 Tax=Rhodoblastus sp. TaxID=1962975 RepID=UPI0025D29712|nr:hypothetical protein [Rhodoblastus sp.]
MLDVTDEEIDAVIAEFEGDPRAAIRALLHDLATLAVDSKAAVSRGFVRGRLLPFLLGDGFPEKK